MQNQLHQLITLSEMQNGLKLKGHFGRSVAFILMKFLRIRRLNNAYSNLYDADCEIFVDNCINARNNRLVISKRDLKNIPSKGSVVFLFNHPYGGLDALVIIKALLEIRPDTKFIGNYLLGRAEPIAPLLFKVNPFETHKGAFSSFSGLKEMFKHINEGNSVCILPAGMVSTTSGNSKIVEDREWQPNIMKYILSTGAPVVSGYVTGQNSKLFHFLGKIHPLLRTACLPHELINKKNLKVHMRFSGISSPEFLKSIKDNEKLANILRAKTYCLEEDNYDQNIKYNIQKDYAKLIEPINKIILQDEVNKLNDKHLILNVDNYYCFYASHEEIPNILKEISSLREFVNRKIGLGTGNSQDLDDFDFLHKHLFVWDNNTSTIIGACRISACINSTDSRLKYSPQIDSVFKLNDDLQYYLNKSIEVGKLVILPMINEDNTIANILKKSLSIISKEHTECKYLIASTSISNLYSKHSKILLLEYLKNNYNWSNSTLIESKKDLFDYTLSKHHRILLETFKNDIESFDRLIKDIDSYKFGISDDLKMYLSYGGKIVDIISDLNFVQSAQCLTIIEIE